MSELNEHSRGCIDEGRRAADVHERLLARRPADLVEKRFVDSASMTSPSFRPLPSEGEEDVDLVVGGQSGKLFSVDDLGERPRGVEQPRRDRAVCRNTVTQHRAEWDDAGAAREQEERATEHCLPDEVAAERTAQLQRVAGAELGDEVGRDLAVVKSIDGEDELVVLRRGGDRVAALRLVAVLRGQPHVHVLTGPLGRPTGAVEDDAAHPRRFDDALDDAGDLPVLCFARTQIRSPVTSA
jgi:hypothetical protein